jgi:hypothetical protein
VKEGTLKGDPKTCIEEGKSPNFSTRALVDIGI